MFRRRRWPVDCPYSAASTPVGNDLKKLIDIPDAIVEVDINNPGSIRDGFKKVIELSDILSGTDLLGDKGRQNLSWRAYAERYSLNISHCMQTKR